MATHDITLSDARDMVKRWVDEIRWDELQDLINENSGVIADDQDGEYIIWREKVGKP